MEILKTGTRLKDVYGTLTVYERTVFAGRLYYTLMNGRNQIVAYPCQIGKHYEVVSCTIKDCSGDIFTGLSDEQIQPFLWDHKKEEV